MKIPSILLVGVIMLSASASIASADGVRFYGGSSMARWNQGNTPTRFEINFGPTEFPHPVSIVGSSGAMLGELTAASTVDVWNHKPRVVVFYGGENDIRAGGIAGQADKKAEYVFERFKEFVQNRDASDSESSAILFVSIKPSIDFFYKAGSPTVTDTSLIAGPAATPAEVAISTQRRIEAWRANDMIHNWILNRNGDNPHKNLYYISIWQPMLEAGANTLSVITDDKPNPLYFEDFTHPSWQGYDEWAKVLRPRISRIWDLTPPVN